MTNKADLISRISINPKTCSGKPCIRGHRIWVSLILDLLADGFDIDRVLEEYPQIEKEDILACIAYGSLVSHEKYVDIPFQKASWHDLNLMKT